MKQLQFQGADLWAYGLLLGIVGITAIALVTRGFGWPLWMELLAHFQLQYFLLCCLGLGILALMQQPSLFWVGGVCTVALSTQILPWYLPPHFLSPGEGNLRLLAFNLNTRNAQFEDVLDFVHQVQPDMALFMEVSDSWRAPLDTLSEDWPYQIGQVEPGSFGIVLYSRWPLEDAQIQRLGPGSKPTITGQITVQGHALAFVGTHPLPPFKPDFFRARNQQLSQIGTYLQTVSPPYVVVGDLNITPWSPYYRQLVRRGNLKNARQGFGLRPSWPTANRYFSLPPWLPLLFSIPIDHCLLSPEISVANFQVGPGIGSDHRPLIVDLQL